MGREATQRHGRHAAVQRDSQPAHAHLEGRGHRSPPEFDGDFNFDVFRQTIQRRLHLLDPLRYRLVDIPWKLHHPMWMENCEVDLDYHLRPVQIPSPGGRRELDQVIGEIASTPLDRDRPLWEFHFAEGMADNRFALIGKVHHTLADGLASANLLARLLDLIGSDEERDDYATCVEPSRSELLRAAGRDHVAHVAALPGLVRDAVRGFARVRRRSRERSDHPDMAKMFKLPPTFLNHVVSPGRTFATASLSLAEVKETAKHLGVTFNDIVLAMAAGGLRELLLRYDGRADRPIIASVPVATDRSPDRITGNEISGLPVSLPVHIDDAAGAGAADLAGRVARQGGQRAARPEAARTADGIPATAVGSGPVSVAVRTGCAQPHHERRRLQRAGSA